MKASQNDWKRRILSPSGTDPAGINDVIFGDGIEMADNSGLESERQKALADYAASIPDKRASESYLGDYTPDMLAGNSQLGQSQMQGISTDPKLRQYQLEALASLQEQATLGMSAQDKADMGRLDADVNRQNAGRIGAIQQNMAARGMGGSGAELVAQMSNSQDATQRQAQGALEKEAMMQNNKRSASMQLGAMGGQMQAQDFGQQAQQAGAQDAINRFNTANSVSRENTNNQTRNNSAQYNNQQRQALQTRDTSGQNDFNQQKFNNQGAVNQLKYNSATNDINANKQEYANAQNAKQQNKSMGINAAGSIVGSIFSDENLKKNISKLSDADIEEFLDSLAPKKFKYKDSAMGEGQRMGVLAQDIERSKVGKSIVKEAPEGKTMDISNVIGALLNSVSLLNKRVK